MKQFKVLQRYEGHHSNRKTVYMSHFDKLVGLPKDFVTIASSKNSEYAGIAHQTKPIYGRRFLAH